MRRCLLVLALVLMSSTALAQSTELTPPGELDARPKLGSLGAEVGGALLGHVLATGLTVAMVLPTMRICMEYCEDHDEGPYLSLWAASLIARPLIVGGLTAAFGRGTGGRGRSGIAMLGALPGVALTGLGWVTAAGTGSGAALILVVLGHVATMGGAVLAYQHSAENNPRKVSAPRPKKATRFVPTPYADPTMRSVGVVMGGTF